MDADQISMPVQQLTPRRRRIPALVWILTALLVVLCATVGYMGWYGYGRLMALSVRVATLEANIATTTAQLRQGIEQSSTTLTSALQQEQQKATTLQNQLGSVQQQFGTITSTVDTLQKLSTIDPELLKKYSKVYFLNENYTPAHLSTVPQSMVYSNTRQEQFLSEALPFLQNLINSASSSGVAIYVASAYRSFGTQAALKADYSMVYGAGTANSFSADQGYSEHQLGTAVDFITPGMRGQLNTSFADTSAFQWLTQNAYKYGFELSYPKGNQYYVYEPWHWRFVGIKLATYLHDNNLNFYDVDQRTIDPYLANLFDPQ